MLQIFSNWKTANDIFTKKRAFCLSQHHQLSTICLWKMVGAPRLIRVAMAQVTENPLRQQKKINARLAGVSIISSQPFGGFAPCAHKCRQDPLDGWRGRPIKSTYKCSLVVTTKWCLIGLDVFSFHNTSIYQYFNPYPGHHQQWQYLLPHRIQILNHFQCQTHDHHFSPVSQLHVDSHSFHIRKRRSNSAYCWSIYIFHFCIVISCTYIFSW